MINDSLAQNYPWTTLFSPQTRLASSTLIHATSYGLIDGGEGKLMITLYDVRNIYTDLVESDRLIIPDFKIFIRLHELSLKRACKKLFIEFFMDRILNSSCGIFGSSLSIASHILIFILSFNIYGHLTPWLDQRHPFFLATAVQVHIIPYHLLDYCLL